MPGPNVLSNTTILSSDAPGGSATGADPAATVTGVSSPSTLLVSLSVYSGGLRSDNHGILYSFRDHPRVKTLISLFSVVEIVSVQAFVAQSTVLSASSDLSSATTTRFVRFGIVPRATATQSGTTGVVNYIPSLRTMSTSFGVASVASASWDVSNFPPGLQLDLKALETRHNYPEFLLANSEVAAKLTYPVAHAQLDFTVRCSGQNFGAIY
jgi:hypothetical protein